MIVLLVVPVVVGTVVVGRLFGAGSRPERLAFGAALGTSLLLAALNVTWRFFAPETAALVAIGVLPVFALVALAARPTREPLTGWRPTRRESFFLAVALVLVVGNTFAWELAFRDDDLSVHYPLLGNLVRGETSLRNPQFPDLPYAGHYGKNLLVAMTSTLTPWSPFELQVLLVPALHAGTTLVFYALVRAHGGNALVAAAATFFAWVAAGMELRSGMLETFQNNNSLVYFLFFANVHFLLRSLALGALPATLVTGLVLGTYALVYETHFGILLLSFATLAAWQVLRGDVSSRPLRTAVVVGLVSVGLAVVQGGALTNVVERRIAEVPPEQEDVVGLSQEVNVRFPKWPPRITSYHGFEYAPWSRRLTTECGPFVVTLPFLLLLAFATDHRAGMFLATSAVAGIAVPALVGFGRYDSDVFRFLFASGILAAALWAGGFVMAAQHLSRWAPRAALACGVLLAAVFAALSPGRALHTIEIALRADPSLRVLDARQWAVRAGHLEPIDLDVVARLREHAPQGGRVLVWTGGNERHHWPGLLRDAMVAAFSGTYVVGTGLVTADVHSMLRSDLRPASMTKIAFFDTGRTDLLSALGPGFIVTSPEALSPDVGRTLASSPHLRALTTFRRGGTTRTVWEVGDLTSRPLDDSSGPVSLVALELPDVIVSRETLVVPLRLVFEGERAPEVCVRLEYRVHVGDRWANPLDTVPQQVCGRRESVEGVWTGRFVVVGPLDPGEYTLSLWRSGRELAGPDGAARRFPIRVRKHAPRRTLAPVGDPGQGGA